MNQSRIFLGMVLLFVPLAVFLELTHATPALVFFAAALAIVPLAGYIGEATEELAKHMGPSIGGLLNATFGNATELIITIFAVRAGELDVVRASIIGSIIGNILLVLGLSIFLGGLKHKKQTFNQDVAGSQSVMLILAVVAVMLPSLFVHALPDKQEKLAAVRIENFSLWVAGLLVVLYLGSLIFSLVTHREMFAGESEIDDGDHDPPKWKKRTAFLVLGLATATVAVMSEFLVSSIEPTVEKLGVSKLFVGVIVVPIIGNAAEHATAVTMALKNKMDVSLNICVSSSTQIALFVAPLIVFLSIPLGHPLPFVFNDFEIIAIGFSALIAALIARDGDSNWFEGAQLLIVYAILAFAFYFVPK